MHFKRAYLLLFFVLVAAGAVLLIPTTRDLATVYTESSHYPEAAPLLDRLVEDKPDDRPLRLQQARVAYRMGHYERSLEALEHLARQNPDDPEFWRTLAHTYGTVQRHAEAAAAYERLLDLSPADSQALYRLEEYYRWSQQPEKRRAILERLIGHYPLDDHQRAKLVDLYLRLEQEEEAVEFLERTVAAFPEESRWLHDLAGLYHALRDERAVTVYSQLHSQYPDEPAYVDGLISALIVAERAPEALERFDGFYASRLDRLELLRRRANLLVYSSNLQQAIVLLQQVLEEHPTPDTRLRLAELHARLQAYEQAASHLRVLVQSEPRRADYWLEYIAYLEAAEKNLELSMVLEEYLQRWPEDTDRLPTLAEAYLASGQYPLALLVSTALYEHNPGVPGHRERLGRVLVRSGNAPAGALHLSALLADAPADPTYQALLLDAVAAMEPGPLARRYAYQVYASTGPAHLEAALLTAGLHLTLGQPALAEAIHADLYRTYPDSFQVHQRIGYQLLNADRPAPAQQAFEQALNLHPRSLPALNGLAAAVYATDRTAAIPLLLQLDERDPGNLETLYRLALAHDQAEQPEAARQYFDQLLLHAGTTVPAESYERRRLAYALDRTGATATAIELLEQTLELHPEDTGVTNDLAQLLIASHRSRRALDVLRRIPEL